METATSNNPQVPDSKKREVEGETVAGHLPSGLLFHNAALRQSHGRSPPPAPAGGWSVGETG